MRVQYCWGLYLDEGCSTAGRGFSRLGGAALLERCRKVGAQHYWGEVPPCSVPLMRHLLDFLLLLLASGETGRGRTGPERKRGDKLLTITRLRAGLPGTECAAVGLRSIK